MKEYAESEMSMEPLDRLLAEMESGNGVVANERGLQFRLDPQRVRQTLSGLVKADHRLWLKHLLQLLYGLALEGPISISRMPHDLARLHFVPADPEVSAGLLPERVYEKEGWLLAQGNDAVMARVLCEIEGGAVYRHSGDAARALVCSPGGFRLAGPADGCHPRGGISLDFQARSLFATPRLFGYGPRSMLQALQPLCGLSPHAVDLATMQPLVPDWPFPPPAGDDDERPQLWDWETVIPARTGGFSWTVSALAEVLQQPEGRKSAMVRHPMELKRAFSTLPILGCYPPSLSRQLAPRPRYGDRLAVRAQRVFGISWTASVPKKAELFPVIKGVPGRSMELRNAPAGLYLLADASHLRTDASGLALVQDQATLQWVEELADWCKEQTELYLPFMPQIPHMWLERVRRWEDLGRPAGAWKRIWQSAVTGLFSVAPVQGLIDRRASELSAWSRSKP
jgi:hypothetical protein